jgi:hypothetical protein
MKFKKNIHRLILSTILLCFATIAQAQNDCRPNNSLSFHAHELNINQVAQKIFQNNLQHSKKDLEKAVEIVNRCQNLVDDRISNIGLDIAEKEAAKTKMIRNRDIQGINQQIRQNQDNKTKIIISMKKSLENISYKGLYLAVMKYNSIFQNKQQLTHIAENLITQDAITQLNGEFIDAVTETNNHELVKDQITQVIQGQMDVDNVYLSKLIPGEKMFYYLSKVSVSPLKRGKQDKNRQNQQTKYQHLVMHANQSINRY